MKKKRVLFRADGSKSKGYGHVIRLLSLATLLKNRYECVFVIQKTDDFLKKQILKVCDKIVEISITQNMKAEANRLSRDLLKADDIVVIDGYDFNTDYQVIMKNSCFKLICVDDLHQIHFVADAVINHSEGIKRSDYSKEYYTKLYLGSKYAILRSSFLKQNKKKSAKVGSEQSAFISMGGSDEKNFTKKALELCVKNGTIQTIHVVVGSFYKHNTTLDKIKVNNQHLNIIIYSGLSEKKMAELMKSSSLAICSASTVSYEYASVGGVLFVWLTATNQKNIYSFLIKSKLAFSASRLNEMLIKLSSPKQRMNYFMNKQTYFSGNSGDNLSRIFSRIENERDVDIRKAELSDVLTYFKWVNEPEVRNNSVNSAPISLKEHKHWFLKKLNDRHSSLFVLRKNKLKLGQARFDREGDSAMIDYSVDQKYRGKGYGELLLRKSIAAYTQQYPGVKIKAKVKTSNLASNEVFNKLEFVRYSSKNEKKTGYNYYRLANMRLNNNQTARHL